MRGAKRREPTLLILGDINVDVIGRVASWPEPGGEALCPKLELHCGGVGANTALALRSGQIKSRLVGCVGQDRLGDLLLQILRKAGVDIGNVQRTRRSLTGLLYINVTPDGQRTFFGSRGANQWTQGSALSRASFESCAAAHLVGYSFLDPGPEKAARHVMRSFRANGKPVSLDIGMEPSRRIPGRILRLVPEIDLLFVSQEEAAEITGFEDPRKSFRRLVEAGAREIVMKLGRLGSLISDGGKVQKVPPFFIRAVDSTGAGDAFTAAFLQARLLGWPAQESALLANAAGASAASVVGAGANLTNFARIARLLRAERLKMPWEQIRLRVLSRLRH